MKSKGPRATVITSTDEYDVPLPAVTKANLCIYSSFRQHEAHVRGKGKHANLPSW